MNKILYIGTGLHIEPILDFPETKEFIFIDTQPRSEFDDYHKFDKNLYHTFYSLLRKKFRVLDFELDQTIILDKNYEKKYLSIFQRMLYGIIKKRPKHLNPTLLVFNNKKTNQVVKYYISTNFTLNKNKELYDNLKTADTLIISGYFPNVKLLDFFEIPKKLICYSETYYNYSSETYNNCSSDDIDENHINPFLKEKKYFSICYFVDMKNNYKITEYKNYSEMFKNIYVISD